MGQLNIENRELENERLEFKTGDIVFLGPNLTLRKCTLVLRVAARDLILIGPRLIDCTIHVKKELKNLRWYSAFLKGCQFTGRMTGNDFGRWPYDEHPERGGIEDCDFTGAQLDACRFIDCDLSTLKLPSWPCFTFFEPMRRKRELLAVPWPKALRITMLASLESPLETAAVTHSAAVIAKQEGVTEESLRAFLEKLDGVKL
ncbi:MAG TPA: hypothetical protein VE153_15775 [Myxococcus sp.]|jgi:hypothetical protein|nr:hypothetical protein [Myxococcus sp.]